ncbi:hypothetical protein [Nitrosopumilus sp.]|uniref:hypothetical protein n=1 Tax=Nitrosopumilus sp. TaxID=2024843 RepID=UPI003B594868
MRITIIVLIALLIVGSGVIISGFMVNQQDRQQAQETIVEILTPYEKLEKYKNELEKINLYNQQVLEELQMQIENSDAIDVEHINEEIFVVKKVISENKKELEDVIQRLAEMKDENDEPAS